MGIRIQNFFMPRLVIDVGKIGSKAYVIRGVSGEKIVKRWNV